MLARWMFLAVALAASPAGATNYPWCTTGASQEFGARNCGFVSFEQCMQSARGNGQFCERNPMLEEKPAPPARVKPRKSLSR